ncbi:MAG: OsmC family peroxiredoxin [Thermoplasmata archaeon]|nr:OsmC family peroxiredoxin [Thermoplasmata archaeon]
MAAERTAVATWERDLLHGEGRVKPGGGAWPEVGISWSARTEQLGNRTSPEELLAAAHASCYAMAFSNTLAKMQLPSTRVTVKAVATFDKVGDGWKVTTMDLHVDGVVAGATAAQFDEAAKSAGTGCPISKALAGNVEIRVHPKLLPG